MDMETLFLTCCLSRCCDYASRGGGWGGASFILSGGGSMGWIVGSAHGCELTSPLKGRPYLPPR